MAETKLVNKVIYNGEILIDLTADTVEGKYLVANKTAHGADGQEDIGTMTDNSLKPGENDVIVLDTINDETEKFVREGEMSYTIPEGYHDGLKKVKIDLEAIEGLLIHMEASGYFTDGQDGLTFRAIRNSLEHTREKLENLMKQEEIEEKQ